MTKILDFTYPSSDGRHTVHAREWLPEGEARGVVQIVHGVAEYIARYDHVARFLNDHGYIVCGEDHLGHGETAAEDEYGYFSRYDGWTLVTADIRTLRQTQGKKYPGLPYFMLGHSMGSFLTRTYLCRYPGELTGAILSGTGQESGLTVAAGKLAARMVCSAKGDRYVSALLDRLSLGSYNTKFRPNRTTADWLSRDEAAVDAYLADPLCGFKSTAGMFRDMMGGLQYISKPRHLAQMDKSTPIYLFSGDQDPVGSFGKGVKKVYGYFDAQGVKDLRMKLYPGGRHEMFNEINKEEVLTDLLNWLDGHLEKAAAKAASTAK